MTIVVTEATQALFPATVRKRAGIKIGIELEIRFGSGIVSFIPKLPSADDEYTFAERRAVDAQLAEADADIAAGRIHGPFDTVHGMIASMKMEINKKAASKKTKRSK